MVEALVKGSVQNPAGSGQVAGLHEDDVQASRQRNRAAQNDPSVLSAWRMMVQTMLCVFDVHVTSTYWFLICQESPGCSQMDTLRAQRMSRLILPS